MSVTDYNIGLIPHQDTKWVVGTGYIFIPTDIPRGQFIADCYIQGTTSIRTEDGSVFHNCPTPRNVFNEITWPSIEGDLGSIVAYAVESKHQQPILVGVINYNDQIVDLQENQFKLGRKTDDNAAEISGSNDPAANITVFVEGQTSASIDLITSSDNNKGRIGLDAAGEIEMRASKNITSRSKTQIEQIVGEGEDSSSSIVQTSSEVAVNASKFKINEGEEALVLGNTLKAFLDDFIDELGKTTVTTALGQMPLLNAPQIIAFKQRTEQFLSKISFTD